MNFKLLILFCLFANVCTFKLLSGSQLKDFLKGLGHKLWKSRSLTKNEINYYMHRAGVMTTGLDDIINNIQSRVLSKVLNTPRFKVDLPDSFDAREHWKECKDVISIIQDQSRCLNCWAVSVASVMSDRACIATKGLRKPLLSANDLTQCCTKCQAVPGDGCKPGIPIFTFQHVYEEGVVTGGKYGENNGCKNYPFSPEDHPADFKSGACQKKCDSDKITYEKNKHYAQPGFSIHDPNKRYPGVRFAEGVEEIKEEIFMHGPVMGFIELHKEFATYWVDPTKKAEESIYSVINRDFPVEGPGVKKHSVRIIGWNYSVVNDVRVNYWIVANSWGTGWGDNGMFKIAMGTNQADIESLVVAALYDETRSATK